MEGVEGSIAVCFSGGEIYFAVQTFHDAGGQLLFRLEVVHDQRLVFADRRDELRDRRESRTRGAGAPLFQIPLGPTRTAVAPELLESFFEQVGADAFEVVLEDVLELEALVVGEVFRILQEQYLVCLSTSS